MAGKWKQVGSIRMSQKGSLYIKIEDASTIADGDALQIEKPEDKLRRLHELGYITDEQLEDRISKLPDWLKYEISQAPK